MARCRAEIPIQEMEMSRGMPSMTALLGLLALATLEFVQLEPVAQGTWQVAASGE